MIAMRHLRQNHARLRDFALYIVIGLFVAMMAIGVAQTDVSHDGFIRWGGLAVNTCVLFGYFIADSRPLFRRWSFWGLTIALLSLHTAAFCIILTQVSQWKLVWFMAMILEVPVLLFFRNLFLKSSCK